MSIKKLLAQCLLLGFGLLVSDTLVAQNTRMSYNGQIGIYNPCNNLVVFVNGPNTIEYHENATEHGAVHVALHMRFEGVGQDSNQTPYTATFYAHGQFDSVASSYDLPFRSVWAGQGNAPSFLMNGTVRVFVAAGSPVGAGIVQVETSCRNEKPEDNDDDMADVHGKKHHDKDDSR
jgi:hypothetical protein